MRWQIPLWLCSIISTLACHASDTQRATHRMYPKQNYWSPKFKGCQKCGSTEPLECFRNSIEMSLNLFTLFTKNNRSDNTLTLDNENIVSMFSNIHHQHAKLKHSCVCYIDVLPIVDACKRILKYLHKLTFKSYLQINMLV